MANIPHRFSKPFKSFTKRTDGSVTVEFVLWIPVFMAIILLAADTSLVFMRQSNFWNVSRDTARIVSRHAMDADAAEAYARNHAAFGGYTPDVDVDISAGDVTVTITGLADKMAPFGLLGFVVNDNISASITHELEPI